MERQRDPLTCPLCEAADGFEETPVLVAELRAYWRRFDYDLDAEFPGLPHQLSQRRCRACGLHWFVPALIGPPELYARLEAWEPYYRTQAWEWDVTIEILRRMGIEEVLEIGAGRGDFLLRASEFVRRCQGIESNPVALRKARERGLAVTDTPLEQVSGGRAAIVAFQLLEHLEDPRAFFELCFDRLHPEGLLIVAVPNQDGFMGELERDFLNRPPHHATLWRRSCFDTAARRFGVELLDYRCAPIEPAQYKLYLMRHARPKDSLAGKLANFAFRAAIGCAAPCLYPWRRHAIAGEAHLAVFRKPSRDAKTAWSGQEDRR